MPNLNGTQSKQSNMESHVELAFGPFTSVNAASNPVSYPDFEGLVVHVYGTFGPGTLNLYGSNESLEAAPTQKFLLHDRQGNEIAMDTAGGSSQGKAVAENPMQVWFELSGADGTTALSAILKFNKKK